MPDKERMVINGTDYVAQSGGNRAEYCKREHPHPLMQDGLIWEWLKEYDDPISSLTRSIMSQSSISNMRMK